MPEISKDTKKRRFVPAHGTASGNAKRIVLVALDVVRNNCDVFELDDLKDLIKVACARLHLAYDSEVVGRAAETALARRARGQL